MAEPTPVRYRSPDEDSARWLGFPVRDGDVVISTRSKSGTTWIQMICALLVFGTDDLPAPLGEISPWLDWLGTPRDEVWRQLAAQRQRRIVKTHTPLDGLRLDPRATYLVGARHPLDMAVSLYHQGDNLDRERMRELTGRAAPAAPSAPAPRPPVRDWLLAWIAGDADPRDQLDSLPGVLWHLRDAWDRRDEPNIVLVHYEDLSADLDGEMRRIARQLRIDIPVTNWPGLVDAARFDRMRDRADQLVPDRAGVLKSRARFFRRGGSGEGRALLSADELERYHARTRELAPPDLLQWLHRGER